MIRTIAYALVIAFGVMVALTTIIDTMRVTLCIDGLRMGECRILIGDAP